MTRNVPSGVLSENTRRNLATLALAGLSFFVLAVLVLHVIERDVAGLDHTMSEFALGKYGWLMVIAFLANSVAALALAFVLLRGPARQTAAAILIGLWGAGLLISAFVPTDPLGTTDATATTHGQIHNLVGGVSFLVCGAGLIVLGIRARKRPILIAGIVGFLAVVTLFLPVNIPEGGIQRIMILSFLVGLFLTAGWQRGLAPSA